MTLPELIELLTEMESSPGEVDGLSELDHGLQCAYELSCVRPDDAELQVAGLVHDIGHQFASDEKHGAARRCARPRDARGPGGRAGGDARAGQALPGRYRSGVPVRPDRREHRVARGCKGVRCRPTKRESFASVAYAADAVVLRRADDAAKVPGRSVPPLEHWLPLLEEVAR